MCGIAGFAFDERRGTESAQILDDMCGTLFRRGPDAGGAFVRPWVALGMRRLSIIDLSGGNQPLYNEDRSIALVCNGEIYNSPELRRQLQTLGHTFATNSDCETIVHGYEEWGEDVLPRLNGMFAFALWDDQRQQLLLARDRAGIKPLHYAVVGGAVIFGSELKALLPHPKVRRDLDLEALTDYLAFEYVPSPRSIFKDISKLPPGCSMVCRRDAPPRITQYWDLSLTDDPVGPDLPLEAAAAGVRQALEQAVRTELISDVPVGVLLSGGIDSSTVAALMARQTSGPVQSFSIAFEDPSFDESPYARQVAAHIGADHHELVLKSSDLWELVPSVASFLDEPLGDSSLIPTYLLSRFVRQHVKVVLGGDGGDELFAGYPTLQAHQAARYLRHVPASVQAALRWGAGKLPVSHNNISLDFKAKRFLAGLPHDAVVRHHMWLGSLPHAEGRQLLTAEARSMLGGGAGYERAYQHLQACPASRELNQILYLDFKLYLENDILPKVDRASMACSLEVRVPLLNRIVLDCVAKLPLDLKIRGMATKFIMKEAVKDLLPAGIISRKKKGFNMPVARWLSHELRPLLEDTLDGTKLRNDGIFEPRAVRQLMDDHFAHGRDNRKQLWTLLVFQQWFDRYASSASDNRWSTRAA
ncbi:MAG TPA: asparagine synthase (glutamine-hydrolyzing) [Chloroflexota bacterium]|nr:asparagine synthase (glutamine-hydrolyzing) [Chloroflexota bacterium]